MESAQISAPIVQLLKDAMPEPIVDVQSGCVYKGYARMGTDETEERWMITRTVTSGSVTKVEYAQSTMEFISAWSNRESYIYTR